MEADSAIAKWYSGRSIFITGATGFMGKVLVEKLLRSCPDVGPIYILVREKKDTLPRDRVDEMIASSAFENIRVKQNIADRERVVPIPGDICLPGLGISEDNNRLLQEKVSVVFHLAATVSFDNSLRVAVAMNLVGTRTLIEMCQKMSNLSAIVHVSTAYSNCNRRLIEERIHPPPADPEKVLHCVAGMSDDLLEIVTPRLLNGHPNTYTFTKALAEQTVASYSTELPIVIIRPSIVLAGRREPSPGWLDDFNGATRMIVGIGKGFLRSIYGRGELTADLIPVDVCINLCIAAAWEIGTRRTEKFVPNVRVYNCVSQPYKSILWKEFVGTIDECSKNYAMSDTFTCPNITMTDSRVKHALISILELSPSIFLADFYLWFVGRKPRFQRFQDKLNKLCTLLEFFTSHEFEFKVDNVEELKRSLTPADRVNFDFDMTNINWDEYITEYFLGIRKHVMKESDETIRASRERLVRWTLLKKAVCIGVLAIFVIGLLRINR